MSDLEHEVGKEPSNTEVMIDEKKVAGHIVKPWTIRKCAEITPAIERVVMALKERNLGFEDFVKQEQTPDGDTVVKLHNVEVVFFVVMPQVPDILKVTLGIDEDELNKISQDDMSLLLLTILNQNIGYLKNSFALITATLKALGKKTA